MQVSPRLITYGVVGLLAFAALQLTPRLPSRAATPAVEAGDTAAVVEPAPIEYVDTLGRGETLVSLFARGGLPAPHASQAMLEVARQIDERRIPAGLAVTITQDPGDSVPSKLVLQLAADRYLEITRGDSGWTGHEVQVPWTTDTIVVAGTIQSSLYQALDESAVELLPSSRARSELAWRLADIFEYRVDMSRDLQVGDSFRALVERSRLPGGTTRIGNVLAASFSLSGDDLQAFRFASRKTSGDYFDQDGKSMRAAFLRAPLEFRRISSNFGRRFHPILKTWKQHRGTDYAAGSGTPVRAIGEGVVVSAGWHGGYGNLLQIRHPNGYVSRYGHLKGFARGIRPGSRVAIGQTVAYVGSTGLSTAPHLHFEVLVGGVQRDPRVALRNKSGQPIPASERGAFEALRGQYAAALRGGEAGTDLATR